MRTSIFSGVPDRLKVLSFELQIWFLIAALTGLRTLKAVVQDLLTNLNPVILTVDLSIFVISLVVLYLIIRGTIGTVPSFVGISLTVLVMFSYLQFGGITGTSEYNLLGLTTILALGYTGRRLFTILLIYSILLIYTSMDIFIEGPLFNFFLKGTSSDLDNFFTSLTTMVILMLYFKNLLVLENKRIWEVRGQINRQNKIIREKNAELEDQQGLIEQSIQELDQEINKHTKHLVAQNKALEEYMILSTQLIHPPFDRINKEQNKINEPGILMELLKKEIHSLDSVIGDLSKKFINGDAQPR